MDNIQINVLETVTEIKVEVVENPINVLVQVIEAATGPEGPAGPPGVQGIPGVPGTGNVVGLDLSVAGRIAIFEDTTGKKITQHSKTISQVQADIDRRIKKTSGPEFTYNLDGNITLITYDDGSTKTFTYTGTRLDRIDFLQDGVTVRKDFNYTGAVLNSITETII